MIVGIVLAAGRSRRMGVPKQTLSFGAGTLLDHVLRDVTTATSLDRVVVVVSEAVEECPTGSFPVTLATNAQSGAGCSTSLRTGLDHARDAEAIVMLLGDMPGVTARIIDAVVGEWRERRSWAAVTRYRGGELGHPFVFSAAAFEQLRGLHGDKAVWKIVDRESPERVVRIDVDAPLPQDIDTWDDYAAVHAAFGHPVADRTNRPSG